jgi:hypothetical protein
MPGRFFAIRYHFWHPLLCEVIPGPGWVGGRGGVGEAASSSDKQNVVGSASYSVPAPNMGYGVLEVCGNHLPVPQAAIQQQAGPPQQPAG